MARDFSCNITSMDDLVSLPLQTASGVSSKVMDDYCWIHSTFHIRSEFEGNVGCVIDTVLADRRDHT